MRILNVIVSCMVITDEQLKQLIIQTGLVDEKGFAEVEKYAHNSDQNLIDAIVEKNILSDENLGLLIANFLKTPFIVLSKISIPEEVFRVIPERLARKKKVIAFARDAESIRVASSNPLDPTLVQMIAKKTGLKVVMHLATERDINSTFHIYKKDLQKSFDRLVNDSIGATGNFAADAVPVEKIVDLLIDTAYQDRTSDIHIEPQEKSAIVRFRIDGILHDVLTVPKPLHERVISRIKVLSRLRTDEHLAAQDGKMRIALAEENLDIRVSILPIVDGEKAVLRLLSAKSRQLSLVDLGMAEDDLKKVSKAYSKSYGMILSTGPTGSGKSTSIYAILKILNTREKNITTIEDPVEYRIKGINQIQVNAKANLTFAAGLRSILRQDPNVVLVGEIRDNETAGIAVNAALTGHIVLSTLHTNDAATALPRMVDMKVEPFLVASTVNVIIGQRLIRKICENCRISYTVTEDELMKHLSVTTINKHYTTVGPNKEVRLYKGQGCQLCHNTGYAGRIGVFEVLEVTDTIRQLLSEKNDADVILKAALEEGMTTMLDDGLQKVAKGLTTIEEVMRVTKVESA